MNRLTFREIGIGFLLYVAMNVLMGLCGLAFIFGGPVFFNAARSVAFIQNSVSGEVMAWTMIGMGLFFAVVIPMILFRLLLVSVKKTYSQTAFMTLYVLVLLPQLLLVIFGTVDVLGIISALLVFLTIYYWIQPVVIKKESI